MARGILLASLRQIEYNANSFDRGSHAHTRRENELLTRVGRGTPGGELLRRYWHVVAAASEITDEKPKKRVRVLGEDLVLYRGPSGNYGLIAEHCAHRGASLYYGFVEEDGIRCAYHGWKYDACGNCLEQPFENPEAGFKDKPESGVKNAVFTA